MKKIVGLIFYILSLLIAIVWIQGLWDIFFNTCKDCPTLMAIIPWWRNPTSLALIIGLPILSFILFKIGKKLRK